MMSISACVTTPTPRIANDGLTTISIFTGSVAEDGVLYKRDFEAAADKACPNGYEIKERSRKPSTLTNAEYNRHYFHWVIKCNTN